MTVDPRWEVVLKRSGVLWHVQLVDAKHGVLLTRRCLTKWYADKKSKDYATVARLANGERVTPQYNVQPSDRV